MKKFVSLWLLITGLCSGLLMAQDALSQENFIRLSFSTYATDSRTIDGLFYYATPGALLPVGFRAYDRSFAHDYFGPNPIIFYRQELSAEGVLVPKPVAQVRIPAGANPALLFFREVRPSGDAASEREFSILAMNDSRQSFPLDHVIFYNATSARLLGRFGDDEIVLEPGLSAPLPVREYQDSEVFIGLVVQYEGSLRKVLQNRWRFSRDNRDLIVLLPPERPNSFRLKALRINEYVEPTTP